MKPCTIVVRNKGRDAIITPEPGLTVVTQLDVTITDDETGRLIVSHCSLSGEGDTLTFPVFYDETQKTSITKSPVKGQSK